MIERVYICSPFKGDGKKKTMAANRAKAIRYARYAGSLGHYPVAPHLYFPEIFDENNDELRAFGLACGLEDLVNCKELWVCADWKNSIGMKNEIARALELGIPIRMMFEAKWMTIDLFLEEAKKAA